jgi:hypothetical protein
LKAVEVIWGTKLNFNDIAKFVPIERDKFGDTGDKGTKLYWSRILYPGDKIVSGDTIVPGDKIVSSSTTTRELENSIHTDNNTQQIPFTSSVRS